MKAFSISAFLRFSGVGVVVTLISMLILFVCLEIYHTPLQLTYMLTYIATILLSYTLNRSFTFNSRHSSKQMLQYFAVYLSGMLLGMLLLYVFRMTLPFPDWLLSYIVIPFTLLNNYHWSRIVFSPKGGKP